MSRAAGEDLPTGDDFWKKLMMERCFADAEAEAEPVGLGAGFAGVRAVLELALSPAMVILILESRQTLSIYRQDCECEPGCTGNDANHQLDMLGN